MYTIGFQKQSSHLKSSKIEKNSYSDLKDPQTHNHIINSIMVKLLDQFAYKIDVFILTNCEYKLYF